MRYQCSVAFLLLASFSNSQLFKRSYSGEILVGTPPITKVEFKGVKVLPDGHFLVWGNKYNNTIPRGILCWFSRSGTLVRTVEHPDPIQTNLPFDAVDVDSNGDIGVATRWSSPPELSRILKFDMFGNLLFDRKLGGQSQESLCDLSFGPNNQIYACGNVEVSQGKQTVSFYVVTQSGLVNFSQRFDAGIVNAFPPHLAVLPDGKCIISGNDTGGTIYRYKFDGYVASTSEPFFPNGFTYFTVNDTVWDPQSQTSISVGRARALGPTFPAAITFPFNSNTPISTFSYPQPNTFRKVVRNLSGEFTAMGAPDMINSPVQSLTAQLKNSPGGVLSDRWSSTLQVNGSQFSVVDMVMDAFGESYSLASYKPEDQVSQSLLLFKRNSAGGLRFQSATSFLSGVSSTSGVAIHHSSGDVCVVGSGDGLNKPGLIAIYRQAPIAIADSFLTIKRNTLFTSPKTVTTNDRQWQGALISLAQNATHGSLTLNSNGTFNYAPTAGFVGYDSFKYTLSKAGMSPSTGSVTLRVIP